ncbi:transporter, partial [Burkholderia mallei]
IGDVLSINGTVGFAVNPDITLNAGVGWQYKQTDKLQNKALGINQTQTNLNLGMAYSLSARNNLVANIRTNISGDEGSVFSLGLTT